MTTNKREHGICFVPHKQFLASLYSPLNQLVQSLLGVVGPNTSRHPEEEFMHFFRTQVHGFGLHTLMQFLKRETQAPLYVVGLRHFLEKKKPGVVVMFDLYHWYSMQCIRYRRSHPQTTLVLYSETKRWPSNILSRLLLRLFIGYLQRNSRYVDIILSYTSEGADFLRKVLPGRMVTVLPASVDTTLFCPDTARRVMHDDVLRILMSARFVEYKRHTDVLQALRILKDKGLRCKISLVGNGGHLEMSLKEQARGLGLDDEVTFLPKVPVAQMREYYVSHDVLVLPSYNEAIGMVVPEAMACGIPTITSDTVGANVYVVEGSTGLIYPTGDVEQLALCLEKLADPVLLEKYGTAARKRIEKSFSPEVIAASFVSLLDTDSH